MGSATTRGRRRRGRLSAVSAAPISGTGTPACHAPTTSLYLFPDGLVRSCCINTLPLGNVRDARLPEIWAGARRADLVARIASRDYSAGCETCGDEVLLEGERGSYPAQFDEFAPATTGEVDMPRNMGFYLSNACNLQCVQCNGESSSSIRLHRERRPALPVAYDAQFFDDLRGFLPHLDHASFVGGEPFLVREHYVVWELIAALAPGLACTIVTNGTQFGPRVEQALAGLRASIVVSIDAVSKERFEAIRVGADFDAVMANLDRFAAYTSRIGTNLSINFCLMPQNSDEFPALLLFAERRSIRVDVSVVRDPAEHSIAALPAERLRELHRRLESAAEQVRDRLVLNRDVLDTEVARVAAWATASSEDRSRLQGSAPFTVLMFRRDGDGPSDDARARADLSELATDGVVHEVVVGPGDVVRRCSPSFEQLVGEAAGSLAGAKVMAVHQALVDHLGPMSRWEELARGEDRTDVVASFPDRELRVTMVAVRGEDGQADHATMLLAEVPR